MAECFNGTLALQSRVPGRAAHGCSAARLARSPPRTLPFMPPSDTVLDAECYCSDGTGPLAATDRCYGCRLTVQTTQQIRSQATAVAAVGRAVSNECDDICRDPLG